MTQGGRWPDRPQGRLVWFHVPREGGLGPVEQLITRLQKTDSHLRYLITTPSTPASPLNWPTTYQRAPLDRRSDVLAFLEHWRPDVVLWTQGHVTPHLVTEVSNQKIPLFLIDATVQGLMPAPGLLRGLRTKSVMRRFDQYLAVDEAAANRLRSQGAPAWRVDISGPLEEGTAALPYDEDDRRDIAEALATRPVWAAMHVPPGEVNMMLEAHRVAVRKAHRFLLILRPTADEDGPACANLSHAAGFQTILRSETYVPGADDQVIVADMPEERGLWYRVAPITFLGGTFTDLPSRNPFEAAALGSAILHGPQIRRFRDGFERLSRAAGAQIIQRPDQLGDALGTLVAPDKAARLAHAAWDTCSSGADVTDKLISLIHSAMPKSVSA